MLFHSFNSQEERREVGGSDFIELQYCRLPYCTEVKDIISVNRITHWQNDSLYISGEDMTLFYTSYSTLITGGIYNNMKRGPMDLCGINFYSREIASQIMECVEKEKPIEYRILLDWLEKGKQYIGFYVLGV